MEAAPRAPSPEAATSDPPLNLDQASLREALSAVRARLAHVERQLAELEKHVALGREEERLLEQLLALRTRQFETGGKEGDARNRGGALNPGPVDALTLAAPKLPPQANPVVEKVIELLRHNGRSLHISELMLQLERDRVKVPGAGTQANLISHLRRDSRIVRPARGMYGLAAWGLADAAGGKRRKRRRTKLATNKRVSKRDD